MHYSIYNIARIGGGKSLIRSSRLSSAAPCSVVSQGRRFLCLWVCALALMFTGCRQRQTICGVPVKGTPWELAAAINDKGDKTFIPETVTEYTQKAYIKGWLNTNLLETPYNDVPYDDGLLPATIACDLVDGQVVAAIINTEFD